MFVDFRHGPWWWKRIAYRIYAVLAYAIFVLIPLIEWVWLYAIKWDVTFSSLYNGWLLAETFMQIQPLVLFITVIHRDVFAEGKEWKAWHDEYERRLSRVDDNDGPNLDMLDSATRYRDMVKE